MDIIAPQPPALFELRKLVCERDDRLLFHSLNACFVAGQVVQVLGANGSGKTTLLRVLAQVSSDYQGEILWRGQPIAACLWEYTNNLLYLGHASGIKKSLTPLENLRWYAALQGSMDDDGQDRTCLNDEVLLQSLADVNLSGYEDTLCFQLSAGQLRRVALARLVFSNAKLWILDEPFTALDKLGVAQLELRLSRHAAAGGLVLVTSHQDIKVPNIACLDLQEFASDRAGSFASGRSGMRAHG